MKLTDRIAEMLKHLTARSITDRDANFVTENAYGDNFATAVGKAEKGIEEKLISAKAAHVKNVGRFKAAQVAKKASHKELSKAQIAQLRLNRVKKTIGTN